MASEVWSEDTVASPGPSSRLVGRCLHRGGDGSVSLAKSPGPVTFIRDGTIVTREKLVVVHTDRGVAIRLGPDGPGVDLVEHLFAALGGLGIHRDLEIHFESDEVPLLGGGALEHARAIEALGVERADACLVVRRAGDVAIGASRYRFSPAAISSVTVTTEFPAPIGVERACWDGTGVEFISHIAAARTFGFSHEAEALQSRGRALEVDPTAVMVLDEQGRVQPPGRPRDGNEIARHKLLDLVGDLYVYGGPPRGLVEATRPGHGATHAAVAAALERGLLALES